MKRYFLLVIILMGSKCFSQDDESGEKKFCAEVSKEAMKLYDKGSDKKKYHKPERLEFLRKCLEEEPDFAEANLAMAFEIVVHCKLENKSFSPTIPYFMKAIKNCPQIHSEPYYYIGYAYYEELKNDSAVKYLNKFIKFKDNDEKKFAKDYDGELYNAKEMVKQCKTENELATKLASKGPVPFDVKATSGVDTPQDEYLAYISPDDKKCYFTRKVPRDSKNQVYASDKEKEVFMIAERDASGKFDAGRPMDWPFNETEDNQGGCTITIDNKHLYFAMMRNEGGATGNCDIYVSHNKEGAWLPYTKLSPVVNHPVYWDSQPTVSADGNSIVFASDRPGGFGGVDLYITKKDPVTGQWGAPQNLGPKINTKGHEKTPFLHSDSETLYFSSGPNKNGEGGVQPCYGGMDIFYTRKNAKGEWGDPENIGTPINSKDDDTGFFVSTDAKTGYFFSYDEGKVRGKGVGRYDLYEFPLYEAARPNEVALGKGTVRDKDSSEVRGAEVEITNARTNEKVASVVDSLTGDFTYAINTKTKDDLIISVKKEGNAFTSTVVKTKDVSFVKPPEEVKLVTEVAEVGKTFVINNIYYNTNSADLKEESKAVLKSFAEYLKANPKMKIEIQGHTDNVGSASANQALSANRAYTVKAALESYGVEANRVTEKGFGSSRPVADNASESGRAKNRRTEFLILSN